MSQRCIVILFVKEWANGLSREPNDNVLRLGSWSDPRGCQEALVLESLNLRTRKMLETFLVPGVGGRWDGPASGQGKMTEWVFWCLRLREQYTGGGGGHSDPCILMNGSYWARCVIDRSIRA